MADIKISALPAASAPTGSEVLPIVQGGITKKATIDQLIGGTSADTKYVNAAGDTMTGALKTPSISFGTNPAASGTIRLPVDGYIHSRNADNTGDVNILGFGNFGALLVGNGAQTVYVGTTNTSSTIFGSNIRIGTNPAGSGAIRLPNAAAIVWRNAGNTADVSVLGHASDGSTTLNASAYMNLTINGAPSLTVTSGGVTVADGKNFVFSATTGSKIGTAATQKLAFYGAAPVARPIGWAAPTGTATRTTYATTTATVTQLAERLKALIDDLTALGLIGP